MMAAKPPDAATAALVRHHSPWRPFVVGLALVLALVLAALFTGIAVSGERAIDAQVEMRAQTLVASLVLARKWNATHGGVYVVKRPGVASNPWLDGPDVATADGRVLTLRNPALMAREMSELSEGSQAFRFRITSLKPLNPENAPDEFEAEALAAFERGEGPVSRRERRGASTWLRHLEPIRVEAPCLACHARQGYRIGDVRGGISVSFPIDDAEQAKARARRVTFAHFLITLGVMVAVVARLLVGLQQRLAAAEDRVRELAVTDDLTGLRNRRHAQHRLEEEAARAVRTGHPLSVALFDLDHFKQVNDRFGHAAGDAVLRAVAAAALRVCRVSDVVARFGGEEFLLVLPETGADGAATIAERLRRALEAMRVAHEGREVAVTASFGLATAVPGPGGIDTGALIKAADRALYRAKAEGRNRVVRAP